MTVASTSCEQLDQPAHDQATELHSSDRDQQTDALEQTVPPDSNLSGLPSIALEPVELAIPQSSADSGTPSTALQPSIRDDSSTPSALTSQGATPAHNSSRNSQLSSGSFEMPSKHKPVSTETLLQRQETIRDQQQQKGRRYKSRTVVRRLNMQKEELAQMAKTVHHGSKQDFLASLAHSVNYSKSDVLTNHDEDWDGSLSPQDILTLAKKAHDPLKRMTVYETIINESAPQHYHLSASDVLDIQDTTSATEIVRALRRKLPGFLDSERKVNAMKAKFVQEFEVIWKPERTHSGWQINPQRLCETLRFLYWWLPKEEWWKIYGDGRNFGGKDSVALTLNVLNDEAMFNGVGYHSPEDYWPISIFYGKDTRLNLEQNLGDPGKSHSLNKWIETMLDNGHKIFLSGDSNFFDSLLGGGLDPTSADAFTMYSYETKETRSDVGYNTGLRSELGRQIEREHPESLLPSLPTAHFIPDGNHCFCRLSEHMVFDRCMTCLNLESQPSMGPAAKDQTLGHFLANINERGVRNGAFELHFDGKKLEQVTLNVNHAETISAPASHFMDNQYSEILHNVASKEVFFNLPEKLQHHLKWPTRQISEYDLETKIWTIHWELHELERLDEDPRKYGPYRLKPGATQGSSDPKDYRFGLTEDEIQRYAELVDLYHALTLLRYGSSKLYPYLMKRVDIFPQMFRELPFHSLFRGGTEGGERTHYLHQCLYFGHSARGGGWKSQDPVITLFRWYYRFLRRRLAKCPAAVQEAFNQYVKAKFEEVGLDYSAEMTAAENSSTPEQPAVQINRHEESSPVSEQTDGPSESPQAEQTNQLEGCSRVSEQTDCTSESSQAEQTNQLEESSPVSEQTDCPSGVYVSSQQHEVQADNLSQDPMARPPTNYRRGDTVFIEKGGETTKAMVCEITPQKKRVKVAVAAKERPVLVEISNLKDPVPQVLSGLTFVISGRLNDKDKTGINNADQLIPVILRNGGKVFSKDLSKVLDANFIMVTSQKELEKDFKKINKPIIHAYRYKWPIVSKLFVLQADKEKNMPEIDQYKLNLTRLDNAPASSLLQAKPVRQSELLRNSKRSAHRDLKKTLRKKRKLQQIEDQACENALKHEPKRAANGYIMFLKQEFSKFAKDNPDKSLKEINIMLAEKWKSISNDEKLKYKELGTAEFQEKSSQWKNAQEEARITEHSHELQTFAFLRMN